MKKPSTLLELIKFFVMLSIGWFLWLIIFAIVTTPEGSDIVVEPFRGASLLFGLLTGLIVFIGLKFNAMQKLLQKTKSNFSNIKIFEERGNKLLDKANRVADKYMDYESGVQIEISKVRASSRGGRFSNSNQFQSALENYPDLKANQSIMELLNQIKECENGLAQQKINYNTSVEEYNALIHSFPTNILRMLLGYKDAEFYTAASDNMVSDEDLGI